MDATGRGRRRPDRVAKMMRCKLVATGVAAAALTAAAPAAFAHGWPGSEGLQHVEVEVPAGALPPGGAVAEASSGGSRYRVRFEMPAAGPARLSFWNDGRFSDGPGNNREVVATSDRGGTFRTTVEAHHEAGDGPPLFLGSADELAAFSKAVFVSAPAKDVTQGMTLGARGEIAAPDCRRLAHARYVVAVLGERDSARGVLACASRGANLLIVGQLGRLRAEADADTAMFARLDAGRLAVAWGYGAVAWLPEMRADVVQAVTEIETAGRSASETMMNTLYWYTLADGGVEPKGVPGSTIVLVLLALYVAVIGPIGYFVGVRPRRAWLAWSWFPLVALGATIALAAGSALWSGKAAALFVNRVSLLAPTGVGLEAGNIHLQGSNSEHYSISVPWRDGDLRGVDRSFRFGSPFSSPAGSLAFTDDRMAGRFRVDRLAVGRHGTAGVTWSAAAERQGAEVSARGNQLTIVNRATSPLRRAVVRIAGLCGTVEEVPAGARRTVNGKDCARIGSEGTDAAREWAAIKVTNIDIQQPVAGSFLIVAESDAPAGSVEATPAIRVTVNDLVAIRGPVFQERAAP